MQILFVSRSLPFHHLGGMEAVAWDLARELTRRGHNVEILTTGCPKLDQVTEIEGVKIKTFNARPGRYSRTFWRTTVKLYRSEYRHKVDTILGIGMGAHAIARAREADDFPTLIMQSHGQPWGELISKLSVPSPISWLKSPKNMIELSRETVLRKYDRIIAVGPSVERVLSSAPTRWMRGKTQVQTITNGINQEHFRFNPDARASIRRKLDIDAAAPVVVSACRLHIQKGVHESLNGFAQAHAKRKALRYIIIGSGPAEESLRMHVNDLHLKDAVRFVGAVDRDILPAYLSAGDLFLFTTKRQEGLPLGPLEAASVGLPSILSKHLRMDGLNAVFVDPDDPTEIAEAIDRKFLDMPNLMRSILPHPYSLQVASEMYENVFRESQGRTLR